MLDLLGVAVVDSPFFAFLFSLLRGKRLKETANCVYMPFPCCCCNICNLCTIKYFLKRFLFMKKIMFRILGFRLVLISLRIDKLTKKRILLTNKITDCMRGLYD